MAGLFAREQIGSMMAPSGWFMIAELSQVNAEARKACAPAREESCDRF